LGILSPCKAEEDFPPFHIDKIELGEKFINFTFVDLEGQSWSNRYFITRPIVFITGNWPLRHDLRKWANYLNVNHALNIDILWVFNPNSTSFVDRSNKTRAAFDKFKPPVPVIIDRHSIIGRSLKIDYRIPTLIGLTKNNSLAFVYASPCNPKGKKMIDSLIKQRLMNSGR
jgi:hypothetical protein